MAETKIAVCNYSAVLYSDLAKNRYEELKAQSNLGKLQAERDGKVADAQAMQKEYEANNLSWDEQRKAKYQRDISGLAADVQLIERKMQEELKAVNGLLSKEIEPVVAEQVQALIDEEKIDILLRKQATLWNTGAVDITNKLIDRLNKVAAGKN